MGNDKDEKAALIGDLKVTMCNKQGVILGTGMIRDVVHLPTGCFNLFSVTKLIKDGWALSADKSALWLTKGNLKINFDIVIPTPKGIIFAMCMKCEGKVAKMMRCELKQVTATEYGIEDRDVAGDVDVDDVEEPDIKAGEGDGQLNDAKVDETKADADEDIKAKANEDVKDEDVENTRVNEDEDVKDEDVANAEESVVEQESADKNITIEDVEMGAMMNAVMNDYTNELTKAGESNFATMKDIGREYTFVGAGLSGGFVNTTEWHGMMYDEAMTSSDKKHWEKAVEEEHQRMLKHEVFQQFQRMKYLKMQRL